MGGVRFRAWAPPHALHAHLGIHHPLRLELVDGWATATECAAYGVLGSLGIAWNSKSLTWENFKASLMGATRVSCMIMFILAGAAFLTKTMAFTGIPRELAEFVHGLNLSPYGLIAVLVGVYLVLGTALDGISMIVLTSAVVLPMVQKVLRCAWMPRPAYEPTSITAVGARGSSGRATAGPAGSAPRISFKRCRLSRTAA